FSTLIIGVIIEEIGLLLGNFALFGDTLPQNLITLANTLKSFMGIGIGIGVAWSLGLNGLSLIAGGIAGGIGTSVFSDPVVAYLTTIAAIDGVRFILRKKTPLDIILIPLI
ncbi:PTS sugar transporter subunit IIC, partial [Methanocalculus natronophilus]|uniref:PTS sugar transporter subunit IIC n=1 Tax=Methanocalculus natronophilus TaxID=1262400 RepID=UPI0031B59606